MEYLLGSSLRKKYVDELKFLSPSYNSTEIYVYSDYVTRTLKSASYLMYGFYPPGTGPILND